MKGEVKVAHAENLDDVSPFGEAKRLAILEWFCPERVFVLE